MSDTVIKVEHLSKHYNLGTIGSGTLYRDFQSWWARTRGKEDPNTQLGTWDASQMDRDNSFWALKDVSFEVKQGDVVGIIGRNGAGKSTLLKILSRVTGPTSGNIKIKGRVASLLEVGTGFHPELTGRENVYLNGTILGMRKAEIDKKFDEIVAFAEIEKFIDTPVKRYSSGMYVRLAFAVAAHLDPEILIVDEVLAVGDMNFKNKCIGKMDDISKTGRTVLFVSHDMRQLKSLCTSMIYLQNGTVYKQGNTDEIINCYINNSRQTNDLMNPSVRDEKKIIKGLEGPKFKTVRLVNQAGDIQNRFIAGDKLKVELNLLPYTYSNKKYAIVWFLHNHLDEQIAVGASYPMDNKLYSQTITNLSCEIDTTSLLIGKYSLRFVMHIPTYDNFDDWKNAISFEIVKSDLHNTNYSYPGIWSAHQYISHQWE